LVRYSYRYASSSQPEKDGTTSSNLESAFVVFRHAFVDNGQVSLFLLGIWHKPSEETRVCVEGNAVAFGVCKKKEMLLCSFLPLESLEDFHCTAVVHEPSTLSPLHELYRKP